jgi:hypothetical chaperone protein
MAQARHTLGVDFGTSNSAAGYLEHGRPKLIEMSPGQKTLPTTFFFDFETRESLIGEPANQALLNGSEGRFMRALKRVLGTTLMHEKRQILNRRVTFVEIIADFLRRIKARAEAEAGETFDHALSGRPVVFHGQDDPREARAEADLRACYLAAGFEEVTFMAEPEAAAIACGAAENPGDIGMIVDIGGGTSDFSVFRATTSGVEILANHGVRIGGTDFDRAICLHHAMPLLGKGSLVRKTMGSGTLPAPNALFVELATWEKIPFVYTARNRALVKDLLQLSEAPDRISRLARVLEHELGHDLAFAVEAGKIDANSGSHQAHILLDQIEPGLSAPLHASALADCLEAHAATLSRAVTDTLDRAGQPPDAIKHVVYVGGSSLMSVISDVMTAEFPDANHTFSDVFTAVADGLALAAGSQGSI